MRFCKDSSSLLKPLSVFLLRVARPSLFIPLLALNTGGKHVVSWRVETDWFGMKVKIQPMKKLSSNLEHSTCVLIVVDLI